LPGLPTAFVVAASRRRIRVPEKAQTARDQPPSGRQPACPTTSRCDRWSKTNGRTPCDWPSPRPRCNSHARRPTTTVGKANLVRRGPSPGATYHLGLRTLLVWTERHSSRNLAKGRVDDVQTTSPSTSRPGAKYFLVRYERCLRCQRALDVEVVVEPATGHYQIQRGTCRRCGQTR
jgi:hypothetical protein